MKNSKKRAFTIVELVIVIAIIAILAAVLIPTFVNVSKQAKESADTQLCRNMNDALAIAEVDGAPEDFSEVLNTLSSAGYIVGNLNPSVDGNWYAWDKESNQMLYLDENFQVLYHSKEYSTTLDSWIFAVTSADAKTALLEKKVEEENIYLVALSGDALTAGGSISVSSDISGESMGDEDDPYTDVVIKSETTIDLCGNTLTTDYIDAYADLTIENGTLTLGSVDPFSLSIGNLTLKNVKLILSESETVLNITREYNDERMKITFENVVCSSDLMVGDGFDLYINGGTYNGDIEYNLSDKDTSVIDGGTFNGSITVRNPIEINGGTFKNPIKTESGAEITINDGIFDADSLVTVNGGACPITIISGTFNITSLNSSNKSMGVISISGGDFTKDLTINATYIIATTISGGTFKSLTFTGTAYSPITISGGTFGGFSASSVVNKLTISGGTFAADLSSYTIAAGYEANLNSDGTYTVKASS